MQIGRRTKTLNSISSGLTGLSFADLRFNRVEGPFLGGKFDFDSVTNSLALRGGLGYSFDEKRWKYSGGATYYVTPQRSIGIGGDVYRKLDNRPDQGLTMAILKFFSGRSFRRTITGIIFSYGGGMVVSKGIFSAKQILQYPDVSRVHRRGRNFAQEYNRV